ncbi:DUF11 domain-containing protein [Candidatus Desantisbacteria bacterium]|nr:DUF11 domain-containing protein [Candidatus Desantisbacteria bacterium]
MNKMASSIRVYGLVIALVVMGFSVNSWSGVVRLPVQAFITVTPTTGTVGTFITVHGENFGTSTQVSIDFGETMSIALAVTDDAGSFTTVFTATQQGSSTVTVYANKTTSEYFYLPDTLRILPSYTSLPSGSSTNYSAIAVATERGEWTVTADTVFTASIGSMTGNIYTGTTAGTHTITGTYTTLTGIATVIVTHGTATSLNITPKTKSVRAGETVTYTATAMDANNNTWDVTGSTTFGVDETKGSMTGKTYTSVKVGTWTVWGTYTAEGKTDTATVIVTYGTATTLNIKPATANVRAGETVTYTAEAMDAKGNTWDVTGSTTFGADETKGSMTGKTYTAVKVGTWMVRGTDTSTGKTGTATVIVTYGTATTLDITPATKSVRAGESATYTATAMDIGGNTWDVTGSTTFGTDETKGSMTTNTYISVKVGTWTVWGTYTAEGKTATDTATVTVTYGTATTLSITPGNALVWVLGSVTYSATAGDIQGNTWPVTGSTTFGVNDLLGTMSKNVYTAGEKGTWTIIGTYLTATGSTMVIAKVRPDLWVIKLGEEEVRQGDNMTYYICYGNAGCSQAGSVTIKDILPPGVSFVSSSLGTPITTGNGTIISPHILTWNLSSIPSQGEYNATITVRVGSTTVGELTNVAEIATLVPDSECNFEYNRATFTTLAKQRMIDLAVSKTSLPEVLQGATFTYKITCNNLGNIPATNVTLTDYLPAGVSYIGNTLSTPIISNNSKTIVWSINSIPAKTMLEFELLVKVSDTALGNITNVVSIHGTKTEQNLSNNQATCMTVVKPSKVDLSIAKQGPGVAKPNSQIRYLISYRNNSNVTATNVTITDILPSMTSYATSTLLPIQTGGTLTWSIGSLGSQSSGYFELFVNIGTITATTTLTNVVRISSTQQDINLVNNQSTATTTVIPEIVDLEIQKWGPQTIFIGSQFSYTIQYRNLANAGLVKATITDTLPTDVTFVSSSLGTPTTNGNTCSWVIDVPQTTSFATITVRLGTVAIGATRTNRIEIAYPGADINLSNNVATWTSTTDEAIIDVEILKYGSWQTTPGGKILYSFWINNIGETEITGGTITDTLPIGLTWRTNTNQEIIGTPTIKSREKQDVKPQGMGTVTGVGFDLTWTIKKPLPAGSCTLTEVLLDVCPAILLYNTTQPASSTLGYSSEYIVNKIRVETIPDDNNTENNEDDFITRIFSGRADVYIYKSGPYEACPGQVIKYNIYGGNYGYSDAGSVTLTDTMPIGVTVQSIAYLNGIRIGSPTITTITNGKWKQQVLTWNNIGTISAPNGIYSSTIPGITTNWFNFVITAKIPDDILPTGWTSINLDNAIKITTTSPQEGVYQDSMNFKTIVVPSQVDLVIYKEGQSDCASGNEMVYNISYYNNGPDIAHTVTVTDILPPGVEYGTDTSGLPLSIVGSPSTGQKLIWTVGTLDIYQNNCYKNFNLTVKVGTLTVNTKLTNKVEIQSKDKEKNPKNNKAEWVTTVRYPLVDLTIYKGGPKEVIRGNNDLWYYIWFFNKGNTTAKDVKIIDTLPIGASYKNHWGDYSDRTDTHYQPIGTPTLSANKQIITWNLGELSPDSSGYIAIMVTANTADYSGNKIYNKVTISSLQPDGNPNNNYAECSSMIINPVTNLHVIKHGPKKVSPGNEMIYTIHYGNAGNAEARDIEIVDTLPKGVTYMNSDIDFKYPPRILGDKVIWRIPKIRHGFNTNFDVRTLVAGTISAGTFLVNKVEITNLPTDNNWKNNVSVWETKVVKEEPDVAVTISGNIARPGFKKNLYVTCSNEGTGLAENVVLTLRLPKKDHVTYDYSYPQGDYNSSMNTVIWSIGSLRPGASKHYRAKFMVKTSTSGGTRLYSQAIGYSTSKEADYKNNKAEEYENVITSYDPNMKTASPQDYVPATATTISYTIHFENMATATANAIKIEVSDKLSDKLDWNTVEIGDICIGGTVSTVGEFNTQLRKKLEDKLKPLVPSQYTQEEADEIIGMSGLQVWYHPTEGTITWRLDFGDYEFGLPPNNLLDAGNGWFSFKVDTIGTLSSGTEITNGARIVFDYNDPMNTPVVKHIVDGIAPSAQVILDPYQVGNTFTVGWSGADNGKIAEYIVHVSENNGTPTLCGAFVETSAMYVGITGNTYTFYCKAKDMAGNVSGTASATTQVLSVAEAGTGTLTKVLINPASGSMEIGETRTLTAQGVNENGKVMLVGIDYTWGTSSGFAVDGTTTNSITVRAIGAGTMPVKVIATRNGATATTTGTYTISVGAIDQITIVGSPTNMEINQQAMFIGNAYNKFGEKIAGQTFAWEVKDAAVGSVTVSGTTSTSATVTARLTGSGWVVAIAGEKQGNLQINVGKGSVATVTISGPTTLQLGQTAVFTAKAYNQSGYELVDKVATWEVTPAPPLCNFTPSSVSSAMLTAQAPGTGTLTGNIEEVYKACAITIVQGTVTKLAITPDSQTIPAGMVSSTIVVQAQNSDGVTVDTPATITLTVTSDSLLNRFSQSASGAGWTGTATYVIPAGTSSTNIFHKYNGTATAAITITVSANGSITATTHSITITALGNTTAGNIVADDGKTMVTLKAGDLSGASFIEINTNPTQPGVNAPSGLVMVAQTLREIKLSGAAGLSNGATVTVTIPYTEANLLGNDENSLQLYRLGSGSTAWEMVTNITRDRTNHTVAGVVSSFSHFVLMLPTWKQTLNEVIVYPNPCIIDKHGYQIRFTNLTQNATIKIFNIAGELVKEIHSNTPLEIWKVDNDDGERVASGIYIYLITDTANNKKVGKLAVIK